MMKWKSYSYFSSTLLVTAITILAIHQTEVAASCKVSSYSSGQCLCQLDSCLYTIMKANFTVPANMLDSNAQSGSGSSSSTNSGGTGGSNNSTGSSTAGGSSNSTGSSTTGGATVSPNGTTTGSGNSTVGGSSSGSNSTSNPAGSNSTEGSTGGSGNVTTESTNSSLNGSTEGNNTTEGYTTNPPVGRRKRSVTDTTGAGNSTDSPGNVTTVASTDGNNSTDGSGNVTGTGDSSTGQVTNNSTGSSTGNGTVTTETSSNITAGSGGGGGGGGNGTSNGAGTGSGGGSGNSTSTSGNAATSQTTSSTTTSLPVSTKRPPPTYFTGLQFDAQKQATSCTCQVGSRVKYDIRFTEEPWNIKLADPSSTQFVTLAKDVERKLDEMYMASNLSSLYVRSWVISFRKGSVVAETETQLNQQKNNASKVVKFSFINGTESGTLGGKSVVTPTAFIFNGSSLLGNDSASVLEKGPIIKPVPKDDEARYFLIVTLPSIMGILTFFCICLCCTRGDSCICKICAEKKSKNELLE